MNSNENIKSMAGTDYYALTVETLHEAFTSATHYFGKEIVNVTETRWGYAGIPLKFEVTTRDERGREMTTIQSVNLTETVWIRLGDLTFAA